MVAPVPVRVKGVYIAESEGSAPVPVVLLEDEMARIVPIFVGLSEAVSIHHALSGELSPRPMTHDLFISVLECLSASITNVLIDDLDGRHLLRSSHHQEREQTERDRCPAQRLPGPGSEESRSHRGAGEGSPGVKHQQERCGEADQHRQLSAVRIILT